MGRVHTRAGAGTRDRVLKRCCAVALLLSALFASPAAGAGLPEYAVTKLDAHFSTLDTLQAMVDLFMGRDTAAKIGDTATTRWSYFQGNVLNLSRILVNNALSGPGAVDSADSLFEAMASPARCPGCAKNFSTALAIIGNNSSIIFGDPDGNTGRARLWKEWRGYLGATDAANASRNVSRLVQFQTSLFRDAITIYTENLKQTYSVLGI